MVPLREFVDWLRKEYLTRQPVGIAKPVLAGPAEWQIIALCLTVGIAFIYPSRPFLFTFNGLQNGLGVGQIGLLFYGQLALAENPVASTFKPFHEPFKRK